MRRILFGLEILDLVRTDFMGCLIGHVILPFSKLKHGKRFSDYQFAPTLKLFRGLSPVDLHRCRKVMGSNPVQA